MGTHRRDIVNVREFEKRSAHNEFGLSQSEHGQVDVIAPCRWPQAF
jgi:hypothetical protein